MSTKNINMIPPSTSCCGPECCDGKGEGGAAANGAAPTAGGVSAAAGVTAVVREKYAAVARSGLSNDDAGVRAVAEAFGYSDEELAAIPAEANMGLSCGNPTAMAS